METPPLGAARPARLRPALLAIPLLAMTLGAPFALAPAGAAASTDQELHRGPARPPEAIPPTTVNPSAPLACGAWVLPEDAAGRLELAGLIAGAVAIARGVYAVFSAPRRPGAPIAGSL